VPGRWRSSHPPQVLDVNPTLTPHLHTVSPRQSVRRKLEGLNASAASSLVVVGGGLPGAVTRVALAGRTMMPPGIGDVVVPVYDQGVDGARVGKEGCVETGTRWTSAESLTLFVHTPSLPEPTSVIAYCLSGQQYQRTLNDAIKACFTVRGVNGVGCEPGTRAAYHQCTSTLLAIRIDTWVSCTLTHRRVSNRRLLFSL
jgi:hypothetical protein